MLPSEKNKFYIPSNCRVIRSDNPLTDKQIHDNTVTNGVNKLMTQSRSPLSDITNNGNELHIVLVII